MDLDPKCQCLEWNKYKVWQIQQKTSLGGTKIIGEITVWYILGTWNLGVVQKELNSTSVVGGHNYEQVPAVSLRKKECVKLKSKMHGCVLFYLMSLIFNLYYP